MGGADAIAVRDRGKALHRRAEQASERLGLGLAELRVLGGDVRHRAVVLAELLSGGQPSPGACRSRIAVHRKRLGEHPDPIGQRRGRHNRLVPSLELGDLTAGKLGDGFRAGSFGQEAERAGCQVVIGVLEGAAAGILAGLPRPRLP
jgi:hypothetical protein